MCFHLQCFSENMEDNNSRDFNDAVDEAEEALSLCDLPLDVTTNKFEEITTSQSQMQSHCIPQSSSHDDQFFEFMSDLSSDMCPAEDIIFCGKLIPSTPPQPSSSSSPLQQINSLLFNEDKSLGALHRRSESLSNLRSTKNDQFLRISRSLDYQKLRRSGSSKTSSDLDMQRSASVRSSGKASDNKKAASKPKWYLPMFGIVKFPPEMDMRDIKSRQFRRSSQVMFPSLDSEGKFPANRRAGKSFSSSSSSWKFIKALSCSDHASVAVTTPLCVSRA